MAKVIVRTLADLLDSNTLPSGVSFELKPDTIDTGLKVAEAKDSQLWREKLMQVLAVTESIGGKNVKEAGGVSFLGSMLDTDIVFLSLAWTAVVNGSALTLPSPIPCPECTAPFTSVDLGLLEVVCYDGQVQGADAYVLVEFDSKFRTRFPESLREGEIVIIPPTWLSARSRVPANSVQSQVSVDMYRAMTSLGIRKGTEQPRGISLAEVRMLPMAALQTVISTMSEHVPSFKRIVKFHCNACNTDIDVPFGTEDT